MSDLTGPELAAWLAENVCGLKRMVADDDAHVYRKDDRSLCTTDDNAVGTLVPLWAPHSDANDLREVLAKVPEEKLTAAIRRIARDWSRLTKADCSEEAWERFLLTAPPLTVCRAVYAAMGGDDATT